MSRFDLAPVPGTTRGSGDTKCEDPACTGHRERCIFGEAHHWSTWIENGHIMRTAHTFSCHRCGGVCIGDETPAEEEDRCPECEGSDKHYGDCSFLKSVPGGAAPR